MAGFGELEENTQYKESGRSKELRKRLHSNDSGHEGFSVQVAGFEESESGSKPVEYEEKADSSKTKIFLTVDDVERLDELIETASGEEDESDGSGFEKDRPEFKNDSGNVFAQGENFGFERKSISFLAFLPVLLFFFIFFTTFFAPGRIGILVFVFVIIAFFVVSKRGKKIV